MIGSEYEGCVCESGPVPPDEDSVLEPSDLEPQGEEPGEETRPYARVLGYYSLAHQCGDNPEHWYEIKEGVKAEDGTVRERHVMVCFATNEAQVGALVDELHQAHARGVRDGMKQFALELATKTGAEEADKACSRARKLARKANEFQQERYDAAQEVGKRIARVLRKHGLELES
jgi:hypothetical protein